MQWVIHHVINMVWEMLINKSAHLCCLFFLLAAKTMIDFTLLFTQTRNLLIGRLHYFATASWQICSFYALNIEQMWNECTRVLNDILSLTSCWSTVQSHCAIQLFHRKSHPFSANDSDSSKPRIFSPLNSLKRRILLHTESTFS